jgi:O-antigen biosynthesis protein
MIQQMKVSIIIPFRDRAHILRKCVASVLEFSKYSDYEILFIDNGSVESKTRQVLEELLKDSRVRVMQYDKPFNYSAINNFAAQKAKGDYLLFLNNDTEIVSPDWLERMLEFAERPNVGAVGAKLLYPDDTIQHAGVMLGPNLAVHPFSKFRQDDPLFIEYCSKSREWSAVTAACMMTRKDLFLEMGGFDEENFAIAYNDVDYCLRLKKEKGLKTMWTPEAVLYHYESVSRGSDIRAWLFNRKRHYQFKQEQDALRKTWKNEIENDPFYDERFIR